jgi:hypothetical protein
MEFLTQQGYKKFTQNFTDYEGVFYSSSIENIEYWEDKCEKLVDSCGNAHNVLIERNLVKYSLKEDDFKFSNINKSAYHKFLTGFKSFVFQFNLNKYCCITSDYISSYNEVGLIIENHRNHYPLLLKNWDAQEESGFYPFFETCFVAGNYYAIDNYIPDKIFFNFHDRKLAISRINNYKLKKQLEENDYENMTDKQLIRYLNDRFQKRILFEKIITNKQIYY